VIKGKETRVLGKFKLNLGLSRKTTTKGGEGVLDGPRGKEKILEATNALKPPKGIT